jgi:hypothetical protein
MFQQAILMALNTGVPAPDAKIMIKGKDLLL